MRALISEKWPKLQPENMDDDGARAFACAILLTAAYDYYYVCDHPKNEYDPYDKRMPCTIQQLKTRGMIEEFFDSELFFVISDVEKKHFINTIRKMKENHEPFPKFFEDLKKQRKKKKEKTA